MQRWHPSVLSVEVSRRDTEGRATAVVLTGAVAGSPLVWTLDVSYEPPRRLGWHGQLRWDDDSFNPLRGSWTFEDTGKGRTRATALYDIDGAFGTRRSMILGVFTGEWKDGLKKRTEAG